MRRLGFRHYFDFVVLRPFETVVNGEPVKYSIGDELDKSPFRRAHLRNMYRRKVIGARHDEWTELRLAAMAGEDIGSRLSRITGGNKDIGVDAATGLTQEELHAAKLAQDDLEAHAQDDPESSETDPDGESNGSEPESASDETPEDTSGDSEPSDGLPDEPPAPTDPLDPPEDENDSQELPELTHTGGGWYEFVHAGETYKVQGKENAEAKREEVVNGQ